MGAIEEELIQVNGKSTEDFANYPVKLDGKFSALQNLVDSADTAPTAAELAVFAELDQRLEAQLANWREALSTRPPPVNHPRQNNNSASTRPPAPRDTNQL